MNDIRFADGVFTIAGTDRRMTADQGDREKLRAGAKPARYCRRARNLLAFPAARMWSRSRSIRIPARSMSSATAQLITSAMSSIRSLADGQIMGGIMQGAGQVFGEYCRYDPTMGNCSPAVLWITACRARTLIPGAPAFQYHCADRRRQSARRQGRRGNRFNRLHCRPA